MGDEGKIYVSEEVVPAYKSLLRDADLILPNQFEAEYVLLVLSDWPPTNHEHTSDFFRVSQSPTLNLLQRPFACSTVRTESRISSSPPSVSLTTRTDKNPSSPS